MLSTTYALIHYIVFKRILGTSLKVALQEARRSGGVKFKCTGAFLQVNIYQDGTLSVPTI